MAIERPYGQVVNIANFVKGDATQDVQGEDVCRDQWPATRPLVRSRNRTPHFYSASDPWWKSYWRECPARSVAAVV